jgi:hypothetical protein
MVPGSDAHRVSARAIEKPISALASIISENDSLWNVLRTWVATHALIMACFYLPSFLPRSSDPLALLPILSICCAVMLGLLWFRCLQSLYTDGVPILCHFLFFTGVWGLALTSFEIIGWDDYSYRLLAVKLFELHGRIQPEGIHFQWYDSYPKGAEAWTIFSYFLSGGENFLNLLHLPLLCSYSFTAYLFLRQIGAPNTWYSRLQQACLPILVPLLVPVAATPMPTVYNDTLVAFFVFASSVTFCRYYAKRDFGLLLLGILVCAACVSIKLSGYNFALWAAIVALFLLCLRRPVAFGLDRKFFSALCFASLPLLLTLSYNWYWMGGLLPKSSAASLISAEVSDPLKVQLSIMGVSNSYQDQDWNKPDYLGDLSALNHYLKLSISLLEVRTDNGRRYYYDHRFAGFGAWAFYFYCYLLVQLSAIRRWRCQIVGIGLAISLYVVLAPVKYNPRYLALFWSLGALACCILVALLANARSYKVSKIFAILFLCLCTLTLFHVQKVVLPHLRSDFGEVEKVVNLQRREIQEVLLKIPTGSIACVDSHFNFPFLAYSRNPRFTILYKQPLDGICEYWFTSRTDLDLGDAWEKLYGTSELPFFFLYKRSALS